MESTDCPVSGANGEHGVGRRVMDRDVDEILDQQLPWDSLQGKTVLVTGAGGMIPSYVVRTLLALNDRTDIGIRVIGLVRSIEKARLLLADVIGRTDFSLVGQDVSAPLLFDGPIDIVVHGASPARPSLHSVSPVDTIRANVQGAFNLLDLCMARPGGRFVLMSSAEVYGKQSADKPLLTEDDYGAVDILNPRASYTEGKRAAETIAASYRAQFGIPGDDRAIRPRLRSGDAARRRPRPG